MAVEKVVESVVEEVASNLEEAAMATRSINASGAGYLLGGLAIGLGLGYYIGRKLNRAKIEAEAYANAEKQIEDIRSFYRRESIAEAIEPKPALENLVENLGYGGHVSPSRPLKPPVPVHDPRPAPDPMPEISITPWNWPEELASRDPDTPYIIHQNEWNEVDENRSHSQVVYTYYEKDDVLVDEENGRPVPHGGLVVGQDNLKWGHGSYDVDVVFVRNERLEMDIQICRSPKSYEEEVLGLSNDDDANTN